MHCDDCQQVLSCTTDEKCWCMTLPNIMPLQSDKNCFCRSCLIKNTRNYIENMANQPIQQQLKLAQQHASSNSFLEGLDYDIENGLMVMTRWAHLKRGKCCSNGCRHCPFSKA